MLRVCNSKLPFFLRAVSRQPCGTRSIWSRRYLFDTSSELDRISREFDRGLNRLFYDFNWPRSFFQPLLLGRVVPVAADGSRLFRKHFEMKNLRPEDIKVSLRGRELHIQGKRDDKGQDGSRLCVEYNYTYQLPEEVDPDTVKTIVTDDGYLAVEAPLPPLEASKSKEIPVQRSSGEK